MRFEQFRFVLIGATALGCSSGPLALNEARLEFSAERLDSVASDPDVAVAIDANSRIQIDGFVVLPCMNYDPEGSVSQVGHFVVMRIDYRRESTCATAPVVWSYTGFISNLSVGNYTLRVVQPIPELNDPSAVVFERILEIP